MNKLKILLLGMSRKFALVLLVILLATVVLVVPPLWHHPVLSGSEWVAAVSICVTTYFGANVASKHPSLRDDQPSGGNTVKTNDV